MAKDLYLTLEDKPGQAARLGEALGNAGVNIEGLCAMAEAGRSTVHILVDDAARARTALEGAGITVDRETEVIAMLARGLQTKQVANALGISVKTTDRHVQNAYRKIGVSSRAAATLFAMEHGLLAWGELRIAGSGAPS